MKTILHATLIALLTALPSSAALYTYQFTEAASLQNGYTLDGNITINTSGGIEDVDNAGNFYIGHSNIVVWNWTLSNGVDTITGSSLGVNAIQNGNGGSAAMYATPTSLVLVGGASLNLGSDRDNVPGADVKVEWVYNTPLYYAGGTGTGGSLWLETDRTDLDAAFPVNPDASATSWTFATAVPEPSISLLCLGGLSLLLRRRRTEIL